jgi:plastocyanin
MGRLKVAAVSMGAFALALVGSHPASAAGAGTPAVAVPGSFTTTYATPIVAVQVGGVLPFVNLDLPPHNVCIKSPDGAVTLGCGALVGIGGVTTDTPTGFLVAGDTYPFYCFAHPNMKGVLVALPGV